jgi:hypothetical protein
MKRRLDTTVTGIYAFPITPDIFRLYARWRGVRRIFVVSRKVVKGPGTQKTLVVFFRFIGMTPDTSV